MEMAQVKKHTPLFVIIALEVCEGILRNVQHPRDVIHRGRVGPIAGPISKLIPNLEQERDEVVAGVVLVAQNPELLAEQVSHDEGEVLVVELGVAGHEVE